MVVVQLVRYVVLFVLVITVNWSEVDQRLVFDHLYRDVVRKPDYSKKDVVFELDLGKAYIEAQSPTDWFNGKGFKSQFAEKIKLDFENGGISFYARRSAVAIWGIEKEIPSATRVRIEWGVNAYPHGANYETGSKYSAISLNVAFGKEKFSSGIPFVPSAPHFFSMFPGANEPAGKIYTHKYWKNTSRHICVSSNNAEGSVITTDFDLKTNFENVWSKTMPTISGFLIAVNTNSKSKAFIRKITFLK